MTAVDATKVIVSRNVFIEPGSVSVHCDQSLLVWTGLSYPPSSGLAKLLGALGALGERLARHRILPRDAPSVFRPKCKAAVFD